ncbi:hypothetical protein [Endozoicomonas sp.]|uniref:hypothetical protein n=1 Tax=Endozoicomonas sp. TaxID=1892382 RepID=UPI003AF9CE04
MENNQDPQSIFYEDFSEYKLLIINGGTFWGRHNVEGLVLAIALEVKIVLVGDFEFNYGTGFFEREDEIINKRVLSLND